MNQRKILFVEDEGLSCDAVSESKVVAEDERMQNLLRLARKVATTNVTVLLSGESGTGKEVFAQYIHAQSHRSNGTFIAINCAAIPENMLEATLFGYEKGAFTGAVQSSAGKFEQAQGGTILLDEISEMDMNLQAKLLRVLQEREVERLGGKKLISLDVRVLATTNRNLREEVKAGRFREDLYYRLNVFPLNLPPLRERRADIYPLAVRFVAQYQPQPVKFTKEAIRAMEAHDWLGNVRELENLLQRALILMDDQCIDVRDLQFEPFGMEIEVFHEEENVLLSVDLRSREQRMIIEALEEGRGSRKWAADRLGISPRTLRYKLARMREAGIQVPA